MASQITRPVANPLVLRLVLAVSLDGRLAPAAGGAAELGGRGDRRVLEEALAWADACLVGAATLRSHGSTCLIRSQDLLEQRRRQQRCHQPDLMVVSRRGQLDPDLALFRQPLRRWWLAPGLSHDPARLPGGFSGCIPLPRWPLLPGRLQQRGWRRVVVLGGARLASTLLAFDLLDELQLTVCPCLLGGPHLWVDPALTLGRHRWQPTEHRDLGGGEWLCRWQRQAAPGREDG